MDIKIVGSGSLYMVYPQTEAAKEWVEENVEVPEYGSVDSFSVEHRYIEDLTIGMLNEGFTVSLNDNLVEIGKEGDVVLCQ